MASFLAVSTPNLCKSPQQQPVSLACLEKPPGPPHMSCTIYPDKSQHWTLVGMGLRWTPQGVSLDGDGIQGHW